MAENLLYLNTKKEGKEEFIFVQLITIFREETDKAESRIMLHICI